VAWRELNDTSERMPNEFRDFEQAGWERAAPYYPEAFGDLTRQAVDAVLDATGVGARTRLLDVACGPGFLTAAAAARGAESIGLDFSPAMIAEARRSHPSVAFREGDAEALPFASGSFDAVVMNFGLLHLARPDVAIGEARRVLAAGGRYGFTIWAGPEEAVGFGMTLKAIEQHGRSDVGLPEGPPFFRFSSAAECRRVLELSGFHDVSVRTLPLTWVLRSPDAVFESLMRGGVRTAAVLRAQAPDALERIRVAVRRGVERFARGERFEIPMPAVLAAGRLL
jgi:SAM-dependent methyltransferase